MNFKPFLYSGIIAVLVMACGRRKSNDETEKNPFVVEAPENKMPEKKVMTGPEVTTDKKVDVSKQDGTTVTKDSTPPVSAGIDRAEPVNLQSVKGQFSYEFYESDSTKCSTGAHDYRNLNALCVGLQSRVQNNDNCALKDRIRLFDEKCRKIGYSFFESRSCEIALYPASKILPIGALPVDDQLASAKYCVGRMSSGFNISANSYSSVNVAAGLFLNVSMTFVPKSEQVTSHDEINTFQFVTNSRTPITDVIDLRSGSIFGQTSGSTLDLENQYSLFCRSVASCDEADY